MGQSVNRCQAAFLAADGGLGVRRWWHQNWGSAWGYWCFQTKLGSLVVALTKGACWWDKAQDMSTLFDPCKSTGFAVSHSRPSMNFACHRLRTHFSTVARAAGDPRPLKRFQTGWLGWNVTRWISWRATKWPPKFRIPWLRTGAMVMELELLDSRLHYQLLKGFGPKTGWVTVQALGIGLDLPRVACGCQAQGKELMRKALPVASSEHLSCTSSGKGDFSRPFLALWCATWCIFLPLSQSVCLSIYV